MKKKKHNSTFRAVALRSAILVAAIWFCAMSLLTWAVAADMRKQLRKSAESYIWNFDDRKDETLLYYSGGLPGDMSIKMIKKTVEPYLYLEIEQLFPAVISQMGIGGFQQEDLLWGEWDKVYGFEPAMIFYDGDQNILVESGNYVIIEYATERNARTPLGRAYIDLEAIEGCAEVFRGYFNKPLDLIFDSSFWAEARMTGYFEGDAFYPVSIDRYIGLTEEWKNVFSVQAMPNVELVTIYSIRTTGSNTENHSVTVNGKRYDSLNDLIKARALDVENCSDYTKNSLLETVDIYATGIEEDSYGRFQCYMAIRSNPLQYALLRLWPTYLISAAVVSLGLLWYLLWLRKSVTQPVKALASALKYGTPIEANSKLSEINQLQQLSASARAAATESNTQLQQLRTALDYAHNAEENRRQLVSDITHELKTPLAVIHSYAECLQENVVPEKREQYLSVILEETRHMDAMVLQMLDLSRLEAGKVRLSSDTFSLLQLTKQTFEKFSPMLSGKNLRLYWQSPEDILLTADEARMTQAVTNLVSNAVKYTPAGGEITVKIWAKDRKVHFSINNSAAHLSPEALEKVWDSFYRADPSRTEPGTGLGLALVKSIIQLHGGQCFVRNTSIRYETKTETGVEFGFTIPLP